MTIPRTSLVLLTFITLSPTRVLAQVPTGVITGTVQTAAGQPVKNASVAIAFRPSRIGDPPLNFTPIATTAADGTFTVSKVPNGKFAVCPSAPAAGLLAPCMWGAEPTVTVANGQTVTVPPIQMKAGVDLYVRVNDPTGKRAAEEGVVAGVSMMLAVRSPAGQSFPVPKTASDSHGADHHLYVPPATDLTLVAFSTTYAMSDGNGAPIDQRAGYSKPFNIPAGAPQHRETITVR